MTPALSLFHIAVPSCGKILLLTCRTGKFPVISISTNAILIPQCNEALDINLESMIFTQ
jgi:hypothetical protein